MSLYPGDHFQKIANFIDEVIWLTDSSGEMLYISPYWTKLTGQAISDATGESWLTCIAKDDQEELSRILSGVDQSDRFTLRVKLISAADHKFVLINGYKVSATNGEFDGYSGTMKVLAGGGDLLELKN